MIRSLIKEKQQAIEKGVAEKLQEMEGDVVEEMMQAALNLDVEKEIERRIEIAKQLAETGRVDESLVSNSLSLPPQKKNVKFKSPEHSEPHSSSLS